MTQSSSMNSNDSTKKSKRLILIRHGCTYMNEYLSKVGSRWGDPNFTDFFHPSDLHLYRDSPLSDNGKLQALELRRYLQSTEHGRTIIQDIEMIVLSPLQRALQTAELAVMPHFSPRASPLGESDNDNDDDFPSVPVVALPLASERVYLISDQGSCRISLAEKYPFADFSKEFKRFPADWWFTVREKHEPVNDINVYSEEEHFPFTYMSVDEYVEWRPNGRGQKYSCHGEPSEAFEQRMMSLYQWLDDREESVICLVSHWGVFEWLTGEDFDNCEIRDVPFEQVRSKVLGMKH